jgi:hypothetical protein
MKPTKQTVLKHLGIFLEAFSATWLLNVVAPAGVNSVIIAKWKEWLGKKLPDTSIVVLRVFRLFFRG